MDRSVDDVLSAVGARLRAIRRDREVTLAALAEATGLTASTLSRLETGKLRPTLEQLLPLARAHGVPLDELVDAPATGDPRIHMRPVRRHHQVFIPLSRRPGGVQAYKMVRAVPPKPETPSLKTHPGYEWMYVLAGRVRLIVGQRDLILDVGEAAEFDTGTPHWVGNAGNVALEVLMLFSHEGERVHVAGK